MFSKFEDQSLRKFVDYLYDNNIGSYVSLPQIAVMGDTSSGKSSLLSGLSGIEFPSDSNITTRCPTRLHMQKSLNPEEYKAEVRIKWERDSNYAKNFESILLEGLNQFHEIPKAIKMAQEFIIDCSSKEVAFDVIEVMISSPDSLNLTLIDLPGIVRSTGLNESKQIIQDIRTLIDRYLQNKRCIILAVVPANVDFHNSQIMADAREVDPTTQRIIPVITKPDLIDIGSEESVLDLLLGKKTQEFALGFHMIKSRGQKDLMDGISIREGIDKESSFFATKQPWSHSVKENPLVFGIFHLQKKLATLQIDLLKKTIPQICSEILSHKEQVLNKLNQLGQDLSVDINRRDIYSKKCKYFESIMINSHKGFKGTWKNDENVSLCSLIESIYRNFGENMLKSRLACINKPQKNSLVTICDSNQRLYQGKIFHVVSNDSDGENIFYLIDPIDRKDDTIFYDKSKYSRDEEYSIVENSDEKKLFFSSSINKYFIKQNSTKYYYNPFSSTDVISCIPCDLLTLIEQNRTHDLPIFLNPQIFNTIVESFVEKDWKQLADELIDDFFDLYETFLKSIFQLSSTTVTQALDKWIEQQIQSTFHLLKETVIQKIHQVLHLESIPYTQNHYLFDNYYARQYEQLMESITKSYEKNDQSIEIETIAEIINYRKKMSCDEHIQHQMMFILQAYGKVATKRIIDILPMILEMEFMQQIHPQCNQLLLSLNDKDLECLLIESSHQQRFRKQLLKELEGIKTSEHAIKNLYYM